MFPFCWVLGTTPLIGVREGLYNCSGDDLVAVNMTIFLFEEPDLKGMFWFTEQVSLIRNQLHCVLLLHVYLTLWPDTMYLQGLRVAER